MRYFSCFRNTELFNSHNNPRNKFCYHLHTQEDETKAQKVAQGLTAVGRYSTSLQLLCSAGMPECGNLLQEGFQEGKIKYKQEADGSISQNLAVQMPWVLCAYVTSASSIRRELFKGDDTEITNSFQNVAHVQPHRHQMQNQGVEILELTMSITCCVGELLNISFSSWIGDVSSTAKWASLEGCVSPRLPFTWCGQR